MKTMGYWKFNRYGEWEWAHDVRGTGYTVTYAPPVEEPRKIGFAKKKAPEKARIGFRPPDKMRP